MNIAEYKIFDWIGEVELQKISPAEAKKKFRLFESGITGRTEQLQILVQSEGVELDHSPESLQALNDVIYKEAGHYGSSTNFQPLTLDTSDWNRCAGVSAFWKSVISDCSIYYGECLKEKISSVHWAVGSSAKREDRHWPQLLWLDKHNTKVGNSTMWYFYIYLYRVFLGKEGRATSPHQFTMNYDCTIENIDEYV